MAYVETVGLIVALFCLPLLGFLLGKYSTAARLTDERDRQVELQDVHTLIDNNRNDVAEQVRSIYDEIKQHQDENSQALQGVSNDVWNKLQEVDENLAWVLGRSGKSAPAA
jgi:CRISPR/Cas system CSM-associated protein Csm2 small subunit